MQNQFQLTVKAGGKNTHCAKIKLSLAYLSVDVVKMGADCKAASTSGGISGAANVCEYTTPPKPNSYTAPFDEETFTPSSRYGNVAEEEFQEFSEENMDENMDENMEDNTENQTPVQFQDTYTEYNKYDNVVLEKEEEEMNEIPRCPTNEPMSRMQVPPSFAMEADDGTVEDNADQRQEAAEDEEERLHLNESQIFFSFSFFFFSFIYTDTVHS